MIDNVLSGLNVTDGQNLCIMTAFSLAIVGSGILGSTLSGRINRLDFIYLWVIFGVATSTLPALLGSYTWIHVLVISLLLGASFGLGMPSCLAYFADCTLFENRGLTSGIILLITSLIAPLLAKSFETFSLTANSIVFAVLRASGLIIFFLRPRRESAPKIRRNISFVTVLNDRSFVLYFVAWLMFCLVDRFEWPILVGFFGENFSDFIFIVGPIISSFFALIGGILSDRVGRKRVVLYGFITLGIAYAIIGLFPTDLPSISWYSYVVISSISTGILWVIFFLILWGDLSQSRARSTGGKYYVIGVAPYFLADMIQLPLIPYVEQIEVVRAFSLASFFLFLVVLPLLYAPETLPEKKIELRRLRKYVEGAKKVKEKNEGRSV